MLHIITLPASRYGWFCEYYLIFTSRRDRTTQVVLRAVCVCMVGGVGETDLLLDLLTNVAPFKEVDYIMADNSCSTFDELLPHVPRRTTPMIC